MHPRHRRAYLAHELVQVYRRHQRVVDDDGGGLAEGAGDEREVGLVEAVPVAAVDEDVHGGGAGPGPRGKKNVEPLGVMPAERHVEAHRQLGADARALGAVPPDPVHRVLYLRAVVVLRVERLLVVVQEYVHAAAFPASEGGGPPVWTGGPPRLSRTTAASPRWSERMGVWGPSRDPHVQKLSGSVRRTQRPPFTTARNDEFAPWCLSGPKFASGPLKMSRYPRMDSMPLTKELSVRSAPAFSSPSAVRSAAT